MCRHCPPSAIVCIEPADELLPLCPLCREERGSEQHYPTAAMVAEHELADDVALCADCYAREAEDARVRATAARAKVSCALCERLEDADLIDHVDTFAGAASVAVCHACILSHGEAMDAICDAARDAAIAHMESSFDLAGPLPTDADWLPLAAPANDACDAGDVA